MCPPPNKVEVIYVCTYMYSVSNHLIGTNQEIHKSGTFFHVYVVLETVKSVLSVEVYAHTFSLLIVVMALECACVCGSYAAPGTPSVTLSLFAVTMLLSVILLLALEQEP